MLITAKEYLSDLFELFYPNVCLACSGKLLKGESILCLSCENELPFSDHCQNYENDLMKRFAGRIELQGAAALFIFHKGGPVQNLLHHLKYQGRKDIAVYAGKALGYKLKNEGS